MSPEVRTEVLAALRPDRGGTYLDRVINLRGPLDFRGEAGAEPWELAIGAGNWIAAAILARYGYEPPGKEALAQYLIRNRLDAADFHGRPASYRLWGALQNLSSADETGLLAFVLEMGKPWRISDLNAGLFLAARYKKGLPHIRLLCEAGGDIDSRLDEVQAAVLDDVALVPSDLKGLSWDRKRALLAEAEMDDSARVIVLWEHPGATPLILAAAQSGGGRIGPWIEAGADVTAVDGHGRTALHWCCREGRAEGVRLLLARDSTGVDRRDRFGERALHAAMRSSDGRVLDALLAVGAAMPETEHDVGGCAPGAVLRLAVRAGVSLPSTPAGAAKLLATLPGMEETLDQALFRAAEGGYWELVALLLTAGARATYTDSLGRTCLHVASEKADARSVRLLLDAGAEVNARDSQECTPLMLACKAGDDDGLLAPALLAAGAEVNSVGERGKTCLHWLANSSSADVSAAARALIAAGASVNAADSNGGSPLHDALRANKIELVGALLDAGADPDQVADGAFAALGLCLTPEAAEMLLAAKASVSGKEPAVAQAALRQAAYGTTEVFEIILRVVTDLCAVRSRTGETLLHQVAWSDKSEDAIRVRAVIAICSEVDARDNDGSTPLMAAARYGTVRAVERLIAAGARVSEKDANGLTAADHAAAAGRWNLAEYLARQNL